MKKLTKEDFIAKAKAIHGDKYDYSKVDYINSATKVTITCPVHGDFKQTPGDHVNCKSGCPKCHFLKLSIMKRLTKEQFIEKAKRVHGDKYDYSKVVYVNSETKVTITCPVHGDFEQVANCHLQGNGCYKCTNLYRTTEQFIEKAKAIHGDKYDYRKVDYINSTTKVTITCPVHGEFEQTPSDHLRSSGCYKCGVVSRTFSKDKFIEKAREVHGDKYDYSKVDYINSGTKVTITCPVHGDFEQVANNHLRGVTCYRCSKERVSNILVFSKDKFIEKARKVHGDKYDYFMTYYTNSWTKVIVTCRKHGEFEQSPRTHLRGGGCPKCSNSHQHTTEEWVILAKDIHGDKYDYSKVEYTTSKTKVTITCPIHGDFEQTPNNHLNGTGCSKCNSSRGEEAVRVVLDKYKISYIKEYRVINDGRLYKYDFYLPDYNLFIEFHGDQHYRFNSFFHETREIFEKRKMADLIKIELANVRRKKILILNETHLKNKSIESFILRKLNIRTRQIV